MKRTQPDTPRRKHSTPRVEPTSRQAENDPVATALDSIAWRGFRPF